MAIVNLKASIKAEAKVRALSSVKTNFSGHHMFSAAYFARQSATIEQNHNNDSITNELRAQHKAYVNGAIICSVASLETTINEVFLDAVDNGNIFKNYDSLIPKLLAKFWMIIEKASILQKYEIALMVTKKQEFNRGESLYQNVDNLIGLRNALVHYKPEWDTDLKKHKTIENRLRNCFNINPFSHSNDAFFPKKCLGHGCTVWAVQSSIRFIEDFYKRMRFPPKWDKKSKSQLRTE